MLLLLLPYQGMPSRRVEVGSDAAAPLLTGFSFPEMSPDGQAYRWSAGEGTILFEDVPNRPLLVRLYMHAMRPTAPPTVTVLLNGHLLTSMPGAEAPFRVGGALAQYEVPAGRDAVGWEGDARVTIRVPPFSVPPDTRELGAAVAWVELSPRGGPAIPSPSVLLMVVAPLLLAAAGVAILGSRLGLPAWAASLAGIAIGAIGAWVLTLAPALPVRSQRPPLGWAWLVPLLVWGGGALVLWGPAKPFRAAARWLGRAPGQLAHVFEKGTWRWVVLVVLIALAIYLPLARTTGYWGDIEIYMAWTHQITHFGIHSAYGPDAPAPPNTTPGLLYPFWAIGLTFRHFFSPDFPQPWVDRTNQGYLRFMLRLPALLSTALIAMAIGLLVRRRWGPGMALVAAAAYVFNPAVIFESAYYGQTGAVHALFILLGVMGLAEGYPALGWASLAAGTLTKPQADIFLPLFFVYTWRRYGFRGVLRSALAAMLVGLVLLAPFITRGTLGEMWARISRVAEYHPMLSATAHNVWWLFSLGNGKASDLLMPPLLDRLGWPIFTYRAIGLALVGLAYLVVLVRVWRDISSRTLYLSAAFLFASFFMFTTQIHENHLIPMFSLLLLACVADRHERSPASRFMLPFAGEPRSQDGASPQGARNFAGFAGDQRLWILYWLFAVAATLNMALHYPDILRVLVPQNPDVWGGREMAVPRWLNSLFQVSLFAYFAVIYVRETFAGAASWLRALGMRKTQ